MGEQRHCAGIRSTSSKPHVWICPSLEDSYGEEVHLAEALKGNGFTADQPVVLEVDGRAMRLTKAS